MTPQIHKKENTMRTIDYELQEPFKLPKKDGGNVVSVLKLTEPNANQMRHTSLLRQEFIRLPILVAKYQKAASEAGLDMGDPNSSQTDADTAQEDFNFASSVRVIPGFNLELMNEKVLAIFTSGGCSIEHVGSLTNRHLSLISERDVEQMANEYINAYFAPETPEVPPSNDIGSEVEELGKDTDNG